MAKKYSWGGKRPGAGRPGERRKPIGARLRPAIHAKLLARAHQEQIPISRLVEQLLEAVL